MGRQSGLLVNWAANEGHRPRARDRSRYRCHQPLVFMTVEGMAPPDPPSHYAVIVVPTTFWLTIMMGGWPFNRISSNPLVVGVAALIGAYVITRRLSPLLQLRLLQGAPVYLQSAPKGCSMASRHWCSTSQRSLSCSWCSARLVAAHELSGGDEAACPWCRVDPDCAGWSRTGVFDWCHSDGGRPDGLLDSSRGALHLRLDHRLHMLQSSLGWMTQPLKGVMNTIAAAAIGLFLANLYVLSSPW